MATTRAEAKKKNDEIYNLQAEQVKKTYDAGIKEINTAYNDQQRAVAVQKLINERKVAESMANLGLTDSGLNRTQQTAVQLSAANAAYNLNRQKQADIEARNLDRDSKLSTIEQNRIAGATEIDQTYDNMESTAKAAQAQAVADAQESASQIISPNSVTLNRNFVGSLTSNGVQVTYNPDDGTTTYIDYKTGQKRTFPKTVNPYTNQDNYNGTGDTAKAGKKYGFFQNGYQPKGVYADGEYVGVLEKSGIRDEINGKMQNVWKTPDGRLWIWDGAKNKYLLYKENG